MIWEILFWVPLLTILHSYLFYPLIINILAKNKKENEEVYIPSDNLPFISIIMSVYNEEIIISEKPTSPFHLGLPSIQTNLNSFD